MDNGFDNLTAVDEGNVKAVADRRAEVAIKVLNIFQES
jgi:hypothetical protein